MVRDQLEEAKAKSEREARRILTYAIQRYASDCTYERTTATIPLPSDEMKGRIIGREGRNIRAIEAATGVSILIDDTPEAVVISCFDPVRKEIARQLMERLIGDGRIHPTRVEELARKIGKEIEEELYQVGEAAVLETGIQGVSPQIMHFVNPELPFGGVGASGIGAYHGRKTFETFSHAKPVMYQSTLFDWPFRYPPFQGWKLKLIKLLTGK